MESWQVIIEPGTVARAEVLGRLRDLAGDGVAVALSEQPPTFRGVDPAIIVATIGAVSANLAVLIGGLMQLQANRKDQRISVEYASGDKVEFPAGMPAAERENLIRSVGEQPKRIILH